MPAWQYEPDGQPPQSRRPPHPSLAAPHCTAWPVHVSLLQPPVPVPHLLLTPAPPHVLGLTHTPQSSTAPQPSPMRPHSALAAVQVVGVQLRPGPQRLGVVAPQT